jgi:hypothetical protein
VKKRSPLNDVIDMLKEHQPEADFSSAEPTKPPKKAKPGQRDVIRRRAFKVLALLSDLGAAERTAVLKAAVRLNRA